jgi:hypothetical protein
MSKMSLSSKLIGAKQVMHDFREYLRAYWVYVSTSMGLGKALAIPLMWGRWNLYSPWGKDVLAVAELVDAGVDGRLGIA